MRVLTRFSFITFHYNAFPFPLWSAFDAIQMIMLSSIVDGWLAKADIAKTFYVRHIQSVVVYEMNYYLRGDRRTDGPEMARSRKLNGRVTIVVTGARTEDSPLQQ